jgi:hypothetical protein
MKVALLGTTLDIQPVPDPSNDPTCRELKKLVEEEFFNHFDVRIDIDNWGYIFERAFAYKVSEP